MLIKFKKSSEGLQLAGPALIFVEGNHVDSKKRAHSFGPDRIRKIVENTNMFMRKGGRVPFQSDHQKTQQFNLGDVEGEFYCCPIDESNLPDPKYRHLIGKLGVFVDRLVAKGTDAVKAIKEGKIRTLSPGIDPVTEAFVEVSATPIPAIIGPSIMFSRDGTDYEADNILLFESSSLNPRPSASYEGADEDDYQGNISPAMSRKTKVFSMEEALGRSENIKQIKTKYDELSEALYRVLCSYYSAEEEELQGRDPVKESYNNIEYFVKEIEGLFELTFKEEEQQEDAEMPESPGAKASQQPQANYSRYDGLSYNPNRLFRRRKYDY